MEANKLSSAPRNDANIIVTKGFTEDDQAKLSAALSGYSTNRDRRRGLGFSNAAPNNVETKPTCKDEQTNTVVSNDETKEDGHPSKLDEMKSKIKANLDNAMHRDKEKQAQLQNQLNPQIDFE